jgi:hypothetical protein
LFVERQVIVKHYAEVSCSEDWSDYSAGINLKLWIVEFGKLKLVAEDEKFSFGWVKGK